MIYGFNKQILLTILLSIFFYSCSSNLDFNQVDSLKREPAYVANLVSFDIPTYGFVKDGVELREFSTDSDLEIFTCNCFFNNVRRTEFDFKITNKIRREFSIEILFLDSKNVRLDFILIPIPAYTGSSDVVFKQGVFEGSRLDVLKKTSSVKINVNMLSGTPLSEASTASLKFSSGITAYLLAQ